MTFGYNANLFSDCATGRLTTFANNLISGLEMKRRKPWEKARPCLYICHSMGGIVLKQALITATLRNNSDVLMRSNAGIVFLATPHRGSASAQLADMGSKIAKAFKLGSASTLSASQIKGFSDSVMDIHESFIHLPTAFNIWSFFELKGKPGLGVIVPDYSAKMEVQWEKHTIGLDLHHVEMCRFEREDNNFEMVRDCLDMLAEEIVAQNRDNLVASRRERSTKISTSHPSLDSSWNYDAQLECSQQQYPNIVTSNNTIESNNTIGSNNTTGSNNAFAPSNNFTANIIIQGPGTNDSQPGRASHRSESYSTQPKKIITNELPAFVDSSFQGREQILTRIEQHFHESFDHTPAFGLYGQGGVGKTQIALKYAHSHYLDFDAIFWMYADTAEKLKTECDKIVARLYPGLPATPDGSRAKFKEYLQDQSRWLLILDNADDLEYVKPYWPARIGGGGSIILTSRNPEASGSPLTASEKVECLPQEAAADFLLFQGPKFRSESRSLTLKVAERVGGLPLALCHVASFVEENFISCSELLEMWESHEDEEFIMEHNAVGALFGYEKTLKTVWDVSLNKLRESAPDAIDLLDILALLDPNGISIQILMHFRKPPAKKMCRCISERPSHLSSRARLRRLGLIDFDESRSTGGQEQVIMIHRLVQDAAKRRWNDSERQRAFECACYCMSEVFPRQIKGQSMIDFYPACGNHSAHILRLDQYFQDNHEQLKPSIAFAEALAHCGWYFYERDQILTAKRVLETAEKICLDLTPPYNLILGLVYNNMGAIYVDLRKREQGAEYTFKAIQNREACLSRDDPNIQELATSYSNYANHIRKLGSRDRAREYYFKGLEIRENCPGCTPALLELTLHNIANFYYENGEMQTACRYMERALSQHPLCGRTTNYMLNTRYAHGMIQRALGDIPAAYQTHKDCLEESIIIGGKNHTMTAVSYHRRLWRF
ncbi:Nb-arc and tpr domain protein [Lasiodiplodia theobromae]|uniref:Nb-arc and tpr domain protein n=1 Tax=Lasiodiplodia theobromae TaxID=45133 RepID=UPI0015C39925|nr:Nb-arc and tpr domain protein [Lasiodiplodia theobromae]KAF4546383.1 Nb-arc and tpr domain protein [Lasiodiplodia theobromae]